MKFASCTPFSNGSIPPFACQENIQRAWKEKQSGRITPAREKAGYFSQTGSAGTSSVPG
jgi:hypothetical protein